MLQYSQELESPFGKVAGMKNYDFIKKRDSYTRLLFKGA